MRTSRLLAPFALMLFSAAAMAADTPAQSGGKDADADGKLPKTPMEWVRYLSDFTHNADMAVDPKKFLAALSAVTEPDFLLTALNAMMDPRLYNRSLASMMDPRAYANYARTMDPETVKTWSQALANPQFYGALTSIMTDPSKYTRLMMAPLDPRTAKLALKALDLGLYARWAAAPLDPRWMGLAAAPMNPQWYGAWAAAMAAPRSYGPAMQSWMAPAAFNGGYPAPALPTSPYPVFLPVPVAVPAIP